MLQFNYAYPNAEVEKMMVEAKEKGYSVRELYDRSLLVITKNTDPESLKEGKEFVFAKMYPEMFKSKFGSLCIENT